MSAPALLLALPAAWLLDLAVGDPPRLYHPVRLVGAAIHLLERRLRRVFADTPRGQRAGGAVLCAALPLLFLALTAALLCLCWRIHPLLALVFDIGLGARLLATRSLWDESMAVHGRLLADDIPGARMAVGRIVGRDTGTLDAPDIARAAVETVAENATDGVVAPLLYLALGGAPLAMWYKAVNTLDSMVGYKNERYLQFGRASARLDDFANYLPARITAGLMLLASLAPGYSARGALRIYRRDRHNHTSPNAAHTEAVCAGALGIRLGGDAVYFGERHHKPTIGDALRPVEPADIQRANRLMLLTSLFGVLAGTLLRAGLLAFFQL